MKGTFIIMKFTCEKPLLLAAILTSSRAAVAKSPIPLLEGLLLEVEDNFIRLPSVSNKKLDNTGKVLLDETTGKII